MEVAVVRGLVESYQEALNAGDSELGKVDQKILVAAIAKSVVDADDHLTTRVVGGDQLAEELDRFASKIAKQDSIGKSQAKLRAWATKKASEAFWGAVGAFVALGGAGVAAFLGAYVTNAANFASGIGESLASAGRSFGAGIALLVAAGLPVGVVVALARNAATLASGASKGPGAVWDAAENLGAGAESILQRGVVPAEAAVFGEKRPSPSLEQRKQMQLVAKAGVLVGAAGLIVGGLIFVSGVVDGYNDCSKVKSPVVTTRTPAKKSSPTSVC